MDSRKNRQVWLTKLVNFHNYLLASKSRKKKIWSLLNRPSTHLSWFWSFQFLFSPGVPGYLVIKMNAKVLGLINILLVFSLLVKGQLKFQANLCHHFASFRCSGRKLQRLRWGPGRGNGLQENRGLSLSKWSDFLNTGLPSRETLSEWPRGLRKNQPP